jgi:hypothetical protein
MTQSRILTETEKRFLSDEELRPSEMYPAAVGIFESMPNRFKRVCIAANENDPQAPEYARAYRSLDTQRIHIVYYPARDVEQTRRAVTVYSVDELAIPANKILSDVLTPMELHTAVKHFIIAQSGDYGPTVAKHYVYARQQDNGLIIEDSKNPLIPYNTKENLQRAIRSEANHPDGFHHMPAEPRVHQHGFQTNLIDKPLCGHYTLQALRRNLANEPIPKLNVFQRNPLLKHFAIGAAIVGGLALIGVGAAATFGVLPAVMIIVGFAVGGTLLASGVIGGMINKFKKPTHNYHITEASQRHHLGFYQLGKDSIAAPQNDQDSSSQVEIRRALSGGNLESLAPIGPKKPEETTRLIFSDDDADALTEVELPELVRARPSFCTIL